MTDPNDTEVAEDTDDDFDPEFDDDIGEDETLEARADAAELT